MINDDFHIAGNWQVETERLKRVVMYSIALDSRCFKWKMNVRSISNGVLLVCIVTIRVSIEEMCLPSFEVLTCWLNLLASCLDNENEFPLKVIASFSASRFVLLSIPFIVLHSLVRSVFSSMVSKKLLSFCGSGCLYSILAVHVRWGLFYGGHLVCSSRPVSLLVQVTYGVCDVQ